MSCVLCIDYGTQSVRVSIINDKGEFLAFEQEKYNPPYFSVKPGYCEQDADYYYDMMAKAAKRLVKKNKELVKECSSISSTCFRDTYVILDKNFKPIRPAIIWLDQRKAKLEKKIPFIYSAAFWLVGMSETIKLNRKRTPALWLQEHEKENWAKARYYAPINSYLNYRMLGVLGDSASNMIGHAPICFKTGKAYSKNHLKGIIYGVDPIMLPKIFKVGKEVGKITENCHVETGLPQGLRYIGTGNDKSCEALGAGAIEPNSAHASFGTSCSIAMTKNKYFEPIHFLPSYITAYPGYYSGEVQIYRGCWMLTRFSKEFAKDEVDEATIEKVAPEEILNKKIMDISPGSNGLVVQPYWGPQLDKPLGKGSIIGFYDDVHTKFHIYRAIIEGLCYAMKEGLISIQKRSRQKCKYVTISGGGSKSDAICQITADILNLPVYKPEHYEASSLGCAISQFISLKVFNGPEDAKKSMVKYEKIFKPNPIDSEKYVYLYKNVYSTIYPKLKKTYSYLSDYLEENNEGMIK